MSDIEFKKYIKESWSFLIHEEGIWGGNLGEPIHDIDSMNKNHLENSIGMIKRWHVPLPKDAADKERLEELKQKKLNELECALKQK